jgi:RNA polymerase sigma-70 factor (ECF subfamily)
VPLTDAVRRAREGDHSAFEELYREHVGRVYAICLRLAGDVARAKELVQDVFVRAWEKLDSFRGEAAFGTWLHRLAVNEVLMSFRAERRRWAEPLEEGGPVDPPARAAPDALRMDLEAAIAALPPGARQVLVLHDIEGYSHAEIAGSLGIAEGTARAHLFRARQLLRETLR